MYENAHENRLLAQKTSQNCKTWMILFKAHDLPFVLTNGSRLLSEHLIIVALLDQWFSVCHPTQVKTQWLDGTFCSGRECEEVDTLQQVSLLKS